MCGAPEVLFAYATIYIRRISGADIELNQMKIVSCTQQVDLNENVRMENAIYVLCLTFYAIC